MNSSQVHRPVERAFELRLDVRAKTIGADPRRGQTDGDQHQQGNEQRPPDRLHECRASRSAYAAGSSTSLTTAGSAISMYRVLETWRWITSLALASGGSASNSAINGRAMQTGWPCSPA